MPDKQGRFLRGEHWRKPKPFWDRAWLFGEYSEKGRSAADIAKEQGCTENAILFWLHKQGIPRRTVSQARKVKHWGASGPDNPMYGHKGVESAAWKGGITPERQGFYASPDWAVAVKAVWKRDKAICQRCGKRARGQKGSFHIHHRITFAVRDIRANIDNLVLLCRTCHLWAHSKANSKKVYIGAFQATMEGGVSSGE